MGHTITPFELHVPDPDIDDLRARLAGTRWPDQAPGEPWAYGTDVALAKALGETEVAGLLAETLEEEKQTDLKLTEVTQRAIMPEALAGEEEDEEGGTDRSGGRGRSGGRRKAA